MDWNLLFYSFKHLFIVDFQFTIFFEWNENIVDVGQKRILCEERLNNVSNYEKQTIVCS